MIKFLISIVVALPVGLLIQLIDLRYAALATSTMIVIINFVPFYYSWFKRKDSLERVKAWFLLNKLKPIEIEQKVFRKGPFKYTDSCQLIYFVTAEDQNGRWVYFWILFGSWWLGLFSRKCKVVQANMHREAIEPTNQYNLEII